MSDPNQAPPTGYYPPTAAPAYPTAPAPVAGTYPSLSDHSPAVPAPYPAVAPPSAPYPPTGPAPVYGALPPYAYPPPPAPVPQPEGYPSEEKSRRRVQLLGLTLAGIAVLWLGSKAHGSHKFKKSKIGKKAHKLGKKFKGKWK